MSASTTILQDKFCVIKSLAIDTLRWRQSCRHFTNKIFKCIFLKEKVWILLKISLNFVPKVQINDIPASDNGLALTCGKPLPELMMVTLLMQICVTQPQWVDVKKKPIPKIWKRKRQMTIAIPIFWAKQSWLTFYYTSEALVRECIQTTNYQNV